jgi:hypothetical protein
MGYMSRYIIFYSFHRIDKLSLHRLMRLKRMNPNITIVPRFGISQSMYFPTFIRSDRRNFSFSVDEQILTWLRPDSFFKLNRFLAEKVESVHRRTEIDALSGLLRKAGMKLYCDFTPMAWYNMDLGILNWFLSEGKNYDFEFLVYFEYDMYQTRTIEQLYDKYVQYNAGFVDYSKARSDWLWTHRPVGSRGSVFRWFQKRNKVPVRYKGFFPGCLISRKALAQLAELRLPFAICELRLPTVLSGLGFSCVRLDFPMVSLRPLSKVDVEANSDYGLFHTVYEDFDL